MVEVSVIVPTRNRAHLIGETIASILGQTFRDLELIIVDDFSEDDTERVVRSFADGRIRYFRNESGRLVAVNRNYGMMQAKGRYIAFCDDDDLWLPRKLEIQLEELARDDGLGLVCTNAIVFDSGGNRRLFHQKHLSPGDFSLGSLLRDNRVVCSSVVVRKSVIDELGMMNTAPALFTGEDYELWLRIARRYRIGYIDMPLVKYRLHAGSLQPRDTTALKRRREIYRFLRTCGFISQSLY
ncbi:MAG: glycosyltransferase, partial [Dehalococcoidales bacterium]|nr:glycosyltransferase [Dehalococcoidales bacterium]